ncbi:hypothetical protein GQ600_7922 [Phytophthora cactorum]|nr:hypothetical protein GQ600_7922 [Phytophthora cactorum]
MLQNPDRTQSEQKDHAVLLLVSHQHRHSPSYSCLLHITPGSRHPAQQQQCCYCQSSDTPGPHPINRRYQYGSEKRAVVRTEATNNQVTDPVDEERAAVSELIKKFRTGVSKWITDKTLGTRLKFQASKTNLDMQWKNSRKRYRT